MKIRQNIERLRGERGLSGATVAMSAGIAPTTYYRCEKDPGEFKVKQLIDVAEVFGVTVLELMA